MSNDSKNPSNDEPRTSKVSCFHDLSLDNSPSVGFYSTAASGSDSASLDSGQISDYGLVEKEVDVKNKEEGSSGSETGPTSSSVSYCDGAEANVPSFGNCTQFKPHKGNDFRWEALQRAQGRAGSLGLGSFRLLKKLGFGDIGSVYLAELRGIGCLYAMKVMDKRMLISRKKEARAQTEREILSILDHPFLPTLYAHFETEKFSCLLMEFCSGGDLHLLRQRQLGRYFSEQATRFYASEVLVALEYLHVMGVVYRDLKPENVLVREDGHIMLSDFDLSLRCIVSPTIVAANSSPACTNTSYCIQPSCNLPVCAKPSCFKPGSKKTVKVSREKLSGKDSLPMLVAEPTSVRSMSFVGTHEYLAPEIIRGDGHGSAVDWWTLGIFLYELLHGKTPFKGSCNRETLFNVVGHPLKFPESPVVSFAAKDLIRGLLHKNPQKRLGFKRGATEIKQHPFFENVNWALVRSNQPPQIPQPVDLTVFNKTSQSSVPLNPKETSLSQSSYLEFDFF